jgi:hypothetical protein
VVGGGGLLGGLERFSPAGQGSSTRRLVDTSTRCLASRPTASVETEGGRVAVLRSIVDDEHEGLYQGRLVVFDGVTTRVLCQARVLVSSRGDLRWADVSPRGLHRAHLESIRRGVLDAGTRLKVALRI